MNLNDLELEQYRRWLASAHSKLDYLTREGKLDDLWIEYHRISNAAEKAKERLNEMKYRDKAAA